MSTNYEHKNAEWIKTKLGTYIYLEGIEDNPIDLFMSLAIEINSFSNIYYWSKTIRILGVRGCSNLLSNIIFWRVIFIHHVLGFILLSYWNNISGSIPAKSLKKKFVFKFYRTWILVQRIFSLLTAIYYENIFVFYYRHWNKMVELLNLAILSQSGFPFTTLCSLTFMKSQILSRFLLIFSLYPQFLQS